MARMLYLANMGTPLMWAGILWLLWGNLFIGLVEGDIVRRTTRSRGVKPYLLMIGANYFSAWCGLLALRFVQPRLDAILTVNNALLITGLLMLAAWAWSVVLEYPFVLLATPRRLRRFRWRTWRASLIAQSVSYVALILWFGSCSSMSLITGTTRTSPAELAQGRLATIHYVAANGRELRSIRLDGTGDTKQCDITPWRDADLAERLIVKRSGDAYMLAAEAHDLPLAPLPPTPWAAVYAQPLKSALAERDSAVFLHEPELLPWSGLLMPGSEGWSASHGYWSAGGLTIRHGDRATKLTMDLPFAMWKVRAPTILRDGLVVFCAGDHILLYDAPTRRIAEIARGTHPLVIPDEPPPPEFILSFRPAP